MSEFTDQKAFNDFLGNGVVFIIDENSSSVRRLTQVLAGIGAKSSSILRFSSLEDAEKKLEQMTMEDSVPKLVICDYNVGPFSGLDFFQTVRDKIPESHKSAFVIVTSNMDQSAVARAAEEDVDAYIIKPFTFAGIKDTILTTVSSKLHPSEYAQLVQKSKVLIEAQKYQEALTSLKQAIRLSSSPTLAYYYVGVLKNAISEDQEAKQSYKDGLKFNKIHFKCQKGLYETYMKEKKYIQAYHVIQTLSEYFPPNAERLSTAIRLAVVTKNFTDIARYYAAFKNLEKRTDSAIGHVCAGLFVLGKYHIQHHDKHRAIESFEKLSATCSGDPKFLLPVMQSLIENMMLDYLSSFFQKLDTSSIKPETYDLCSFYANINKSRESEIVKHGTALINRGLEDFWLYKMTIDSMIKLKFKKKAQDFINKGKSLWPVKSNAWARLQYFVDKIPDSDADDVNEQDVAA